jgi:hypothetical protein
MREITNLVDCGSVHVPPINVLPLEDAIRAHQMIETGHVRGGLRVEQPYDSLNFVPTLQVLLGRPVESYPAPPISEAVAAR